jgi:hypothetical protein
LCYPTGTGAPPLTPGDTVVLYSSKYDKYTCGFGPPTTPSGFQGYISPITPIQLPIASGQCIQTGPGVGGKVGPQPSLQIGLTYLVPEISSFTKGYCPGYSATNSGPYKLISAGYLAVTVIAPPSGDPNAIYATVSGIDPTTSGVTICPIGDTSCSSAFGPTSPTGVELYQ